MNGNGTSDSRGLEVMLTVDHSDISRVPKHRRDDPYSNAHTESGNVLHVPKSHRIGTELFFDDSPLPRPQGTNDILDYLGFPDGEERTGLLMELGRGNTKVGAYSVRAAYIITSHYGVVGNGYQTPKETREGFLNVARFITPLAQRAVTDPTLHTL